MSTSRKTCIDGSEQVVIKIVTAAEAASEEDGTYVLSTSRGCQSECANAQEEPELFELTISEAASIADEALVSITVPALALDFLGEDFELAADGPINDVEFQSHPGYFIQGDAPLVVGSFVGVSKEVADDGTSDKEGEIQLPFVFNYLDTQIINLILVPTADFTTPCQDTWEFRFLRKADGSEYGYMKVTPLNTGDDLDSRNYNIEVNIAGGTLVSGNITAALDPVTGAGGVVFQLVFQTNVDSIEVHYQDNSGDHLAFTWTADSAGQFTSWLSDNIHNTASIYYERALASQSGFKSLPLESFLIDNGL